MIVVSAITLLCIVRPSVYGAETQTQPGLNVVGLPTQNLQPWLHPVGASGDFEIGKWLHDTPLLRSGWQTDAPPLTSRQISKSWFGWKNISFIFSFGDSYTSTNFTTAGLQPNAENPLGNPPYPGATSSNGPNYIDYLTTVYNQSYVQTYNLAYGGATVNPFLVPTLYGASVRTFLSQVEQDFLPLYANNSNVPWKSSNSLFTIFFGINDCIQSYAQGNDSLNLAIIKSYEGLVNELYTAGARNFLFLNVPPVDRSPGQLIQTVLSQKALANYIGTFNFRLGALVYNLALRDPDVTTISFDTNFLFTAVLDNSTQFPETAGYLNTTNYCPAYMEYVFSSYYNDSNPNVPIDLQRGLTTVSGTPTLTYFYPPCGIPVNEYFWLNSLHPTFPMHDFMASQIVQLLGAQ